MRIFWLLCLLKFSGRLQIQQKVRAKQIEVPRRNKKTIDEIDQIIKQIECIASIESYFG
jgi:hypothetical protein